MWWLSARMFELATNSFFFCFGSHDAYMYNTKDSIPNISSSSFFFICTHKTRKILSFYRSLRNECCWLIRLYRGYTASIIRTRKVSVFYKSNKDTMWSKMDRLGGRNYQIMWSNEQRFLKDNFLLLSSIRGNFFAYSYSTEMPTIFFFFFHSMLWLKIFINWQRLKHEFLQNHYRNYYKWFNHYRKIKIISSKRPVLVFDFVILTFLMIHVIFLRYEIPISFILIVFVVVNPKKFILFLIITVDQNLLSLEFVFRNFHSWAT